MQYQFEGQVVDQSNGNGISNATLIFYQRKLNNNVLNSNFVFAGETSTNSSGLYSLSFDREKIESIQIEIETEGYFDLDTTIQSSEITTDGINTLNFEQTPLSWVEIHLTNQVVEPGETFNFYKFNLKTDCESCGSNGNLALTEIADTTFLYMTNGNYWFKYQYGINGANSSTLDSIYCPINDTAYVQITY